MNIKAPPKVKNFIRRVSRNVFLHRIRLRKRDVECLLQCYLCEDFGEDSINLFFQCSSGVLVWQECALWDRLQGLLLGSTDLCTSFLCTVSAENAAFFGG